MKVGLGVDILSLSRARKFLDSSRIEALSRVFSPREQKRFSSQSSVSEFARIFTAKEAFFKAFQHPIAGVYAFHELEVKLLPKDRFEVKWKASDKSGTSLKAQGCHFLTPEYVGAHVLYWR
jgi:phosphopantetheine--protein transferase-like protein